MNIQSEMYKGKISDWAINERDCKIADFQIPYSEISGDLVGDTAP